jgi:hypothetical protein
MNLPPENGRPFDRTVLLLLLALLLFASPFTRWLATDTLPWYLPYLVWAVLIVLIQRLARRRSHDL